MAWKYKFNPLQFFVVLMIMQVVFGWFHELTHGIAGLLGDGVIKGVNIGFGVFYIEFSTPPTGVWGWLMPFAGGLGAGLVALIIVWATDQDDDVRIAFWTVALTQIFYGVSEGTLWHLELYHLNTTVGFIVMLAANVIAVATARDMWLMEELLNDSDD